MKKLLGAAAIAMALLISVPAPASAASIIRVEIIQRDPNTGMALVAYYYDDGTVVVKRQMTHEV